MGLNDILKIGNNLKSYRKKLQLTQAEMAEKIGIPRSTYANYENNTRVPDSETLNKMSEKLNVQIDYLLGISKYKKYDSQIVNDDILYLIEKIDNSDADFSKLIRNIIDTMFLTINYFTREKNTKVLSIVHDLYRNIFNIKLINKKGKGLNYLGLEYSCPDDEFEKSKNNINILLDKFYKTLKEYDEPKKTTD